MPQTSLRQKVMENLSRISIDSLVTFIEVVDAGGFRSAAENLYMTEPAVSTRVKNLESAVGCMLIERGRNCRLTPSGKYFYDYARRMVDEYKEMISHLEQLSSGRAGTLRVAALRYLPKKLISNVCLAMQENSPQATVKVSTLSLKGVFESVKNGDADIGIIYHSAESHPALSAHFAGRCHMITVARTGHPLTKLHPAQMEDLHRYNLFFPSSVSDYSGINRHIAELIKNRPPIVIDDFDAARDFVINSDYMLLAPEMMLHDYLRAGLVAPIEMSFVPNDLTVRYIVRKDNVPSALQTLFVNELISSLSQDSAE